MRRRGFTLLEVMIAMAILAMALTILLGAVNSGVVYSGNARDYSIATFLAEGKMTELERKRDMLAAGTDESGRFEDEFERYSWQYSIRIDEGAKALVESTGATFQFDPMKVEVVVSWGEGDKVRSYKLQEEIFPIVKTDQTTTVAPQQPGPTMNHEPPTPGSERAPFPK